MYTDFFLTAENTLSFRNSKVNKLFFLVEYCEDRWLCHKLMFYKIVVSWASKFKSYTFLFWGNLSYTLSKPGFTFTQGVIWKFVFIAVFWSTVMFVFGSERAMAWKFGHIDKATKVSIVMTLLATNLSGFKNIWIS